MSFYRDFVRAISPFAKIWHRLEVHGLENIPQKGRGFIIACNHCNWFGWDALVVGSIISDKEIRWVSWSHKDTFPIWDIVAGALGAILLNGKQRFPDIIMCKEIFEKGGVIGIFPEGMHNPINKRFRLRPFFPGCVQLAALCKVPIIPCAIHGLGEASPVLWLREERNEPIKYQVPMPVIFPVKAAVHFGEPIIPDLEENQLYKKPVLDASENIREEIFKLLKIYRPNTYLEQRNSIKPFKHF